MENSFNLTPENNDQPKQEQQSNGPTPEQKTEHLEFLSEMMRETGFIETPELKELRGDTFGWREKASETIVDAASDAIVGKKLLIGLLLGMASIYYEKGDPDKYYEYVEDAYNAAHYGGFGDLYKKIEELR